jgi:cytochrome c oxidase cbb3-type subunit 4
MFKHYFEGIEYITVGPIIGLVLFFVFFIVLIYRVITADSDFISEMENKPLEDGTEGDIEKPTSTQT